MDKRAICKAYKGSSKPKRDNAEPLRLVTLKISPSLNLKEQVMLIETYQMTIWRGHPKVFKEGQSSAQLHDKDGAKVINSIADFSEKYTFSNSTTWG